MRPFSWRRRRGLENSASAHGRPVVAATIDGQLESFTRHQWAIGGLLGVCCRTYLTSIPAYAVAQAPPGTSPPEGKAAHPRGATMIE